MLDSKRIITKIPGKTVKLVSLKSKDFRSFFKNAKKLSTPNISFYLKPNQLEIARLGMVVKKKYVRTAVGRNRIKRIIREQVRSKIIHFLGHDLVIFINKPRDKETFVHFRSDLETQWSKLESFYQRYLSK